MTLRNVCVRVIAGLIFTISLCALVVLGLPSPSQASDYPPSQPPSGGPPPGGIDIVPSRFDFEIEMISGPHAGEKLRGECYDWMVLGRSSPIVKGNASTQATIDWNLIKSIDINATSFGDLGINASQMESVFIPRLTQIKEKGIDLPTTLNAFNFSSVPDKFKGPAELSYYVEVGSLDGQCTDSQYGLLLGQPFKEKYPDLYKPAGGLLVSYLKNAKLPQYGTLDHYGIFETPLGDFVSNAPNFYEPTFFAVKASTDENQTFSRAFSSPGSSGERLPIDFQDEGETYFQDFSSQLLPLVEDLSTPVAKLNYFYFTNAGLTKGTGIFLSTPNQQSANTTLNVLLGNNP